MSVSDSKELDISEAPLGPSAADLSAVPQQPALSNVKARLNALENREMKPIIAKIFNESGAPLTQIVVPDTNQMSTEEFFRKVGKFY